MNRLSNWASRHNHIAIGLIVLLEGVKGWLGVHIGYRGLPLLPALVSEMAVLLVVTGALVLEQRYHRRLAAPTLAGETPYRLRVRSLFWLFIGSFVLALLLGNRCQQVATFQTGGFSARADHYRTERPANPATNRETVNPHDRQRTRPLTGPELREERRSWRQKRQSRPAEAGPSEYVLLFLLGVVLAFLGTGLACRLSCAHHGFAAVLVGLIALGALVGGFYFLFKAFRRRSPNPAPAVRSS